MSSVLMFGEFRTVSFLLQLGLVIARQIIIRYSVHPGNAMVDYDANYQR